MLHSPDMLALLIPVLRAEFAALEAFQPTKRAALSCPISAFGGAQDSLVPRSHLEAWREQTDSLFRVRVFPGGHFYMNSQLDALLGDITATLTLTLNSHEHTAVTA